MTDLTGPRRIGIIAPAAWLQLLREFPDIATRRWAADTPQALAARQVTIRD